MFRKIVLAIMLLSLCIVVPGASFASAPSGNLVIAHEHQQENTVSPTTEACPVSGEPIMGNSKITYEYKGKTYRFCCPECIEEFKKDPEKYINKMNKQEGKESKPSRAN